MRKTAQSPPECRLCLGPCDPEIHAATVNIHQWLKDRVLGKIRLLAPDVKSNHKRLTRAAASE